MAEDSTEFAAVFMQHNKGAAHAEATEALARVTAACHETGKKGSVTVTLTIDPQPKLGNVVKLTHRVVTKVPQVEAVGSIWYPADDGTLHRNDPTQHELFAAEDVVRYDEPRVPPPVRPAPATAGTDARQGATNTETGLFSDGTK